MSDGLNKTTRRMVESKDCRKTTAKAGVEWDSKADNDKNKVVSQIVETPKTSHSQTPKL